MLAGDRQIAVDVGDLLASSWTNRSRFREAAAICERTLSLGDDYRVLHSLARAEETLGKVTEALGHYNAALAAAPDLDSASDDEVHEISSVLHNRAGIAAQQGDVTRALDLLQQALELAEQIRDLRGKAAILHQMGSLAEQQGDVPLALNLYQQSLDIEERTGNDWGTAATLHNMASLAGEQGDVARAQDLLQQALELTEQVGDVKGKAATLHSMGKIAAERGDMLRARDLYQQALELRVQIGDVQGNAASLRGIAAIAAEQADVTVALDLYQQSLALTEQIGDVRGKAATLANIAAIQNRQGAPRAAEAANLEAVSLLAGAHAWPDLAIVLGNMGTALGDERYLAQAGWLALRVGLPVHRTISLLAGLYAKVEPASESALLMAATVVHLTGGPAESHRLDDEMRRLGVRMLAACAEVRNVVGDKAFREWFESEHLGDPSHFLPALDSALVRLTGDTWLFDHDLVTARLPTEDRPEQ